MGEFSSLSQSYPLQSVPPSGPYASSAHYNEATQTCEMPLSSTEAPLTSESAPVSAAPQESLVCEEHGSSQSEMPFVETAQLAERQSVPESRFQSTLESSRILASIELEAQDIDGVQTRSQGDIRGTIQRGEVALHRDVFAPSLKALEGTRSENKDDNTVTEIRSIDFDPHERAYVVNLKVTKSWEIPYFFDPSVWDHFQVKFKANARGELTAELEDNWMPDGKILSQLEAKVRHAMRERIPTQEQQLRLETQQSGNTLRLIPQVKNLEIPLGDQGSLQLNQIAGDQARLRFDAQGHLRMSLNQVPFQGSTGSGAPAAALGQSDSLSVKSKIAISPSGEREVYAQGQLGIHLSPEETQQIRMGHDQLSYYMRSGDLRSDFSLHYQQQPGQAPQLESHSEVSIDNADLGGGQKVNMRTALKLRLDDSGIHLDPADHDYSPLQIQTSDNAVQLYINGSEYFPEMKSMIRAARESVHLETFMFTEDAQGRELALELARKASEGVPVRFIYNSWKGEQARGEASARMLEEAQAQVRAELQGAGLSEQALNQRSATMAENLQSVFFTEGILRSDHRKVLVIDGEQATVGGMNLGEKYLSDQGYHDVSLKLVGPEVRRIQREFIENWQEFRQQPPLSEAQMQEQLKSEAHLSQRRDALRAEGVYGQQAQMQMLVTDDHQVDIERGLVALIDGAQSEINIQQAFFSDETINRHLAEALERGVKINVIVAEKPLAESVFSAANLLSVYELAKRQRAGAPGEVKLFYYGQGLEGKQAQIHTKAITVDGERALIGSANMIGRSLSSPFWIDNENGPDRQVMYNKEMSLLIDAPDFVEEINQRLFDYDIQHHSRELDLEAIEAEVEKAGGESKLRQQAIAAPYT